MISAIVYLSAAGHTKQYAELAGAKMDLPVYELTAAKKNLPKAAEIVYLGWLMAGKVKGYTKAAGRFRVKALCPVGMATGESQLGEIKKVNHIPEGLPVFYLQGGFELEKLHGIYRLMMSAMKSTAGKGLSDKKDRTTEEDAMLELMLHGGSCVSEESLSALVSWYKSR